MRGAPVAQQFGGLELRQHDRTSARCGAEKWLPTVRLSDGEMGERRQQGLTCRVAMWCGRQLDGRASVDKTEDDTRVAHVWHAELGHAVQGHLYVERSGELLAG